MKNFTFIVFFILFITSSVTAQIIYKSADSLAIATHTTQIQKLTVQVDTLRINIDSIKNRITLLAGKSFDKDNDWGVFICLLPCLLFILMLLILNWNLRDKFSLADALSENDLITKTIENKQYNIANINAIGTQAALASQIATLLPPTLTISGDAKLKSSSRYLAVITGFTALIIAICMIMFYMYSYIKNPAKPVDFTGLSTVILSLIVGIAPYSFNKLSEGIKSKTS